MHPHMLRHTFVTTVLDAGVSPRDVQIAAPPRPTHAPLCAMTAHARPSTATPITMIVCDGPPYQVYATAYERVIGSAGSAEEAAELVVANLPPAATPGTTH
jgi:hypothetical protein